MGKRKQKNKNKNDKNWIQWYKDNKTGIWIGFLVFLAIYMKIMSEGNNFG